MATDKQKYQIVIEAKEAASKKIAKLRHELAALGGPAMVKSQREIKKLERNINQLSGEAKKGSMFFSRFTQGVALGNIAANAASFAINKLAQAVAEVGQSIMVAANVQELGAVLSFVGQRAGYSKQELDGYVVSLRKSGIAQLETNQALLRAIQGNIKLTEAVKLGRIAQDAAVIGQMNSSEAYTTLIDAVVKGRVVLLKSLGIQGTFQASYKKLAKELNKTQASLTETERQQARLNLVFEGGKTIAGAYETAMGSASKQLRSMDRLIQDLQVSVGQYFVPALSVLVKELSRVTKATTAAFKGESAEGARQLAADIGKIVANAVTAARVTANFGKVLWNAITIGGSPIAALLTSVKALAAVLRNPFDSAAWDEAGTVMGSILEGAKEDWSDIKDGMAGVDQALIDHVLHYAAIEKAATGVVDEVAAIGQAGADAANKLAVAIPAMLAELDEIDEEAITITPRFADEQEKFRRLLWQATLTQEQLTEITAQGLISRGILDADAAMAWMEVEHQKVISAQASQDKMTAITAQFAGMTKNAIGSMTSALVTGRQSFAEVFKGIALDFAEFFIQQALASILNIFIPGLGSLLGGIFDTPANDRMAAEQGQHFAQWFTRGALAELQGGTPLAVGVTASSQGMLGAGGASGTGSGGVVVMHVSVTGNVMTDEFVADTLEPKLARLIADGKSRISLDNDNETGGRSVRMG
jgi:hypothetical protein